MELVHSQCCTIITSVWFSLSNFKNHVGINFSALFLYLKTQDKNMDPTRRVSDRNCCLISSSVKAL